MIGAFLFFIGLAIGSFLNVCIYRIPRNLSIIKPSSFCPNCKTPIKFYHNIPIISYLLLKGKCRYCGAPISIQYPAVELITGILNVVLYLRYGLCLKLFFMLLFAYALVVITVIDIRHQII
ncbi:MAG: prepilin peptidase, partial [Deltaproteobacteria bacterium]